MKIQLFSINPDLKETYKNVKQCHSSHNGFVLENIIFYKNITLACNRCLLLFQMN